MKITIPFFLLLFFLVGCFTPRPLELSYSSSHEIYKGQYTQFLTDGEIEVNSWFHYLTSTTKEGKYVVRKFFPEKGQITSLETYKTARVAVKDGLVKKWFDNGSRSNEGFYKNNKKVGIWKYYYHTDNSIRSQGGYTNGKEHGVWKTYDSDGWISGEKTYFNGVLEGKFIMYDSMANVINSGVHKADTIFEESNPDVKIGLTTVEEMPYMSASKGIANKEARMKRSQEYMLQYIYRNIRYPDDARIREVEGTALVRFYIDKDGSVKDIQVLKGLCQSIAEESKKIVEEMPSWEPGTQNGKPVKVYFNLPLRFRLE